MNLLQIFFIISGIIIFIISLDIARKQKFNALHFLVFLGVGVGLFVFSFFPHFLDKIGNIFGLQRGADLLVYSSIIFLFYFVILLLNKIEQSKEDLTRLVRELAIFNSKKEIINGKYVFIVPGYNEGKVILNNLKNILDNGYNNIIFINDGSRDDTLKNLEPIKDRIIILNHLKNRGQGAAIETGFEYVRRYGNVEFVITFDSDGQHDINDISNFEKEIQKNPHIGIFLGSRFKGTTKNMSISRKIILKLGILFTFIISSIKLSDAHNGYRILKKEVLNDISITLDGMGHSSEIVDIISSKNLPFVEVPVNIIYSDYSKSRGQSSLNAINIGLKVIWNKFFK